MIKDQFTKGNQSVDLNGQTITIGTSSPVCIPLPRMKVNQLTFSATTPKHTSSGSRQAYLRTYKETKQVTSETMTIRFSQSAARTSTKVLSGGMIIDGLYLTYDGNPRVQSVAITFDDVEMVKE